MRYKFVPGSWYMISWIDAAQDADGHPIGARVCIRQNNFMFESEREHKWRKTRTRVYVFIMGVDQGDKNCTGWLALPESMLIAVEKCARPRTQLTKEEISDGAL